MRIIDALLRYYTRTRRAGHTTAMLNGVKGMYDQGKVVIVVVMNRQFADAVLSGLGLPKGAAIVVTPDDIKAGRLESIGNYPMLVDNHVMLEMLAELEIEQNGGAYALLSGVFALLLERFKAKGGKKI